MSRPSSKGIHKDRFNEEGLSIWGLIPLATKVSTQDTGGELYVFQHTNMGKSGPPRHVHHAQDEWFYVVNGEFAAEIGNEKFWLRPGDTVRAARGAACVGPRL
jgi:mannose-6-phosphate isomerase-like protein (cupin superfamily)